MLKKRFAMPIALLIVAVMLIALAACVTNSPEPVVIDSQAARPVEIFKSVTVQGLTDLRGVLDVDGAATLNGGSAITGSLTISGYQQYPVAYWDMDGVNGAMAAHGLPGAPTYPHCMLYTPLFVTASVYLSAANATSVTLAMFDAAGNAWTTPTLAVRCSAVYVP